MPTPTPPPILLPFSSHFLCTREPRPPRAPPPPPPPPLLFLLQMSKRARSETDGPDLLDGIPDDILLLVLRKLSSSASRPSDLLSVLPTCRRLNVLARNPSVLSTASAGALSVTATSWCDSARSYLQRCADLGNTQASYTLGMIMFYCLEERKTGVAEMARAGMRGHAEAIYSLAVIHFNGSGGPGRSQRGIRVGLVLCARAAVLGSVDALRELGHCLQDGYGARKDLARGRRYLVGAEISERREDLRPSRFLVEWWSERRKNSLQQGESGEVTDTRMCSEKGCGRRETRRMEFRRCSVCSEVRYCSRACQAVDWKAGHKAHCRMVAQRLAAAAAAAVAAASDDDTDGE